MQHVLKRLKILFINSYKHLLIKSNIDIRKDFLK